ncbi:MAG: hypothetical protein ABWZ64_18930, partial [Xanthobacteraceae bacterium]
EFGSVNQFTLRGSSACHRARPKKNTGRARVDAEREGGALRFLRQGTREMGRRDDNFPAGEAQAVAERGRNAGDMLHDADNLAGILFDSPARLRPHHCA